MYPNWLKVQPAIFFARFLCLLYLSLCDGAHVNTGKRKHYSKVEENFLINEVLNYPGDYKPIHSLKMWRKIAKKHTQQWKLDTFGFSQERTPEALRAHFVHRMLKSKGQIPIPQALLLRIPSSHATEKNDFAGNDQSDSVPRKCDMRYTEEEEQFIIDEVQKYPGNRKPIHGAKLWEQVSENHSLMRKLNPRTFPFKRTPNALKMHFTLMLASKGKVSVPETLRQKLPITNQGEQNDESGSSVLEESVKHHRFRISNDGYSTEEDMVLINEVLRCPLRPIPVHGISMWSAIAENFEQVRKVNPARFPNERSARGLRSRFLYILRSKIKGQDKESLMKEIRKVSATTQYTDDMQIEISRPRFSQAEHDFIIEELEQTSYTSIYTTPLWENIKKKHDERRLSETLGFLHERTATSLRSHFARFALKGPIPTALVQKYPSQFSALRAVTESADFQGLLTSPEEVNEDSSDVWWEMLEDDLEFWDSMLEELQSASVEIDFNRMSCFKSET